MGAAVAGRTDTQQPALMRATNRAYRIALAERKVTCLILPNDLQMQAMQEPTHEHGMTHSGVGIELAPIVPDSPALSRAARILNAGNKVATLIGAGALGASEQVIAVADRLGAGVSKALLGKAAMPDDHALWTLSACWARRRAGISCRAATPC